MVTQQEVDFLEREVQDLKKRIVRLEGDNVELRVELRAAVMRLGALVTELTPKSAPVEAWRGAVRDSTVPYPVAP